MTVPSPHDMLMAAGGPTSPDARVLRAMASPVIGQFDPAFTRVMDDVMQLARRTFLTGNRRCFAVSAPLSASIDAVLNTLPRDVTVEVASVARHADVRHLAAECHARGALLLLDASDVLGGRELRVDDWAVDVCVAGADHCIGGPSGMALITYSDHVEARMHARTTPPRVSYLDLLQLQAYWSPERLNHHTAPTSLVYGVREALRFVLEEGLEQRWRRHQRIADVLAAGFDALGLRYHREPLAFILHVPGDGDAAGAARELRERFDVHVRHAGDRACRVGLVGAEAHLPAAVRLLAAVQHVLAPGTPASTLAGVA